MARNNVVGKERKMSEIHIKTGDLLLMEYVKPNFIQRTIADTCDSLTTHNETCVETRIGTIETGYAAPPHFVMIPYSYRVQQYEQGIIRFGVLRYKRFNQESEWVERCRDIIRGSILTMARLKVPYDTRDVIAIGRNVIRSHIPWLKPLIPEMEGKVYCTASAQIAFEMAEINIFEALPRQRFCAPIHVERAYYAGDFQFVADFGIKDALDARRPVPPKRGEA